MFTHKFYLFGGRVGALRRPDTIPAILFMFQGNKKAPTHARRGGKTFMRFSFFPSQ
jgi:hypothetical protein